MRRALLADALELTGYGVLVIGPFWAGATLAEALGWGQWGKAAAVAGLYYAVWLAPLWRAGPVGRRR